MTNETNSGTVEKLRDRLEAIVSQPEATGFANMKASLTRHDFRQIIAALTAQSQPAATVQEVGRGFSKVQHELELIRDWRDKHGLSYYEQIPVVEVKLMEKAAKRALATLAALTAEPAAKAGDAVKQLLKTAIDALSHFDPITAGVLQSSYALTNPPSPQPDMGRETDEAFCDAVWAALKGDHNDLRKQQIILKAHRAALSSPASQSVEKGVLEDAIRAALKRTFRDTVKLMVDGVSLLDSQTADVLDAVLAALPHKEEATPAPVGEQGAWPENLAEIIEAELNGWKGANGGIYAIHAAALGVSIKLRAHASQSHDKGLREALRAIASLRQHSREDDADNAATMEDIARRALSTTERGRG